MYLNHYSNINSISFLLHYIQFCHISLNEQSEAMLEKLFYIVFVLLFSSFYVDSTNQEQIACSNAKSKHLDNYPIWKSVNITKRDIVQPIYSKNIYKSLLPNRLFHLDLKGAKPTINYLIELLQFAARYGATGVLLEYEDTFPYSGELAKLRAPHAFSISDIHRINNECLRLNLTLIPLVQTFGHLEFVLKHGQYSHLREVSRFSSDICPSQTESHNIINSMISQILSLHPAARYLHIGCDEVFQINKCPLCRSRNATDAQIYMGHVKAVAQMARNNSASHNLRIIIWDDMLRAISESDLRLSSLPEFVELMVWCYESDLRCVQFEHLEKYGRLFDGIWYASAFKGAESPAAQLPLASRYVLNQMAWLEMHAKLEQRAPAAARRVRGIALTGWQRFDHFATLCELLPAATPTLALCLAALANGGFTREIHANISAQLGFTELLPWSPLDLRVNTNEGRNLKFIGSQLFLDIHSLVQLIDEVIDPFLSKNNEVDGWFTPFHIKKCRSSRRHADQFIPLIEKELNVLKKGCESVRVGILEYLESSTSAEWHAVHCEARISLLQELLSGVQAIRTCAAIASP